MAHQIVMSDNGKKCCTLCGKNEGFEVGCQYSIQSIENKKIEIENKKIEVEKEKIRLGTVLISLVYFIFLLFVAVVYLGLDGLKVQISRVVEKCSKGGLFAATSHLFRRR